MKLKIPTKSRDFFIADFGIHSADVDPEIGNIFANQG